MAGIRWEVKWVALPVGNEGIINLYWLASWDNKPKDSMGVPRIQWVSQGFNGCPKVHNPLKHVSIFFSTSKLTMHFAPWLCKSRIIQHLNSNNILFWGWGKCLKCIHSIDDYTQVSSLVKRSALWSSFPNDNPNTQTEKIWPPKPYQSNTFWVMTRCLGFAPCFFPPLTPPDLHHILLRKCRDNGHHLGTRFWPEEAPQTSGTLQEGINHDSTRGEA